MRAVRVFSRSAVIANKNILLFASACITTRKYRPRVIWRQSIKLPFFRDSKNLRPRGYI